MINRENDFNLDHTYYLVILLCLQLLFSNEIKVNSCLSIVNVLIHEFELREQFVQRARSKSISTQRFFMQKVLHKEDLIY